MQKFC